MKSDLRPAFYALPASSWRDYVTLLHVPYTAWHLSYVVLGAAAAPVLHLDRLGGVVLAFFLAVGLGAHALDEYKGRPLGTNISDRSLLTVAAVSIAGALAIGALAIPTISFWAIPFVVFGGFIVFAYNLELFNSRFHSDTWFGIAWGAFPALTAYWANAERLDVQAYLVAAACFALTLAQRTLSPNPPMRSGLGVGTRGEGRGTRRSALDSDKWGRWRPLVVVGGADGGPGQRRWGGVGGTACRGRQSRTGPVRLCGAVE